MLLLCSSWSLDDQSDQDAQRHEEPNAATVADLTLKRGVLAAEFVHLRVLLAQHAVTHHELRFAQGVQPLVVRESGLAIAQSSCLNGVHALPITTGLEAIEYAVRLLKAERYLPLGGWLCAESLRCQCEKDGDCDAHS